MVQLSSSLSCSGASSLFSNTLGISSLCRMHSLILDMRIGPKSTDVFV